MSTVLITGANRGIGLEFVKQYSADGWQVFACCRAPSDDLQSCATVSDAVHIYQMDVSDSNSIKHVADEIRGTPIDVLLNNAGRFGRIPLSDGGGETQAFGSNDYEDWTETFHVNVQGPVMVSEAFIEHVAASEQKKIVIMTSFLGSITLNTLKLSGSWAGGLYAYRTSKTSVNIVVRSMAADLADRGVSTLAIHPGWVKTEMGGPDAEITAEESVSGIRNVIASLTLDTSGSIKTYEGQDMPL